MKSTLRLLAPMAPIAAAPAALAQNSTVDTSSLLSQVAGAQGTASAAFLAFAGLAVAAFVLGAVIHFSRRGAEPERWSTEPDSLTERSGDQWADTDGKWHRGDEDDWNGDGI